MSTVINQSIGRNYALYHGDSAQVLRGIPDNSVHLCVHSPPFQSLYIYSDSIADLGNSGSDEEFFRHYRYIIDELHRVMIPGRIVAVHCKDLPRYFGRDGAAGLIDFPGRIIQAFEHAGFAFHSRITIWKDPVIEMQRTKNSGLLYSNLCQDSSCSRQGMADYMVMFRKWEGMEGGVRGPAPVTSGAERFNRYVGLEPPDPTDIAQRYGVPVPPMTREGKWPAVNPFPHGSDAYRQWSIRCWQKYASPVWFDINQTRVLDYQDAKGGDDEKHLCPLQLDVIERCVHLWTNDPQDGTEPETVLTPFAGVGSELVVPLELGRRAIGIELKESYYQIAARTLEKIENRPVNLSFLGLVAAAD